MAAMAAIPSPAFGSCGSRRRGGDRNSSSDLSDDRVHATMPYHGYSARGFMADH